jgi:hypothetical protein
MNLLNIETITFVAYADPLQALSNIDSISCQLCSEPMALIVIVDYFYLILRLGRLTVCTNR